MVEAYLNPHSMKATDNASLALMTPLSCPCWRSTLVKSHLLPPLFVLPNGGPSTTHACDDATLGFAVEEGL